MYQSNIWIACGKEYVDLVRAVEILAAEFGDERMGIVGGPKIKTAFLFTELPVLSWHILKLNII